MATKYWDGGGAAGDFDDANNWSDNAIPVGGDTLIFSDNSEDITGGDFSAVTSASTIIIVGNLWTGEFGSSGSYLKINCGTFEYSGKGKASYVEFNSAVTTVSIAETGSGSTALNLGGTSTITTLRIVGGSGTINATGARTITTVEIFGARSVILDLSSVAISGTTLRMDSGSISIGDSFTNIEVSGGSLTITGNPTAISTLDIYGGRVKYNASGSTAAITSRLAVYDGEFDASELTASVATISGTVLYEDGKIDERNGLETITWSGGITTNGGDLLLDAGRLLTIS